jgi:predicted HicB family RNase H-like nuclease
MLRVRITPEERKAIEVAAKTGKKSVSDWIRGTLTAALEE